MQQTINDDSARHANIIGQVTIVVLNYGWNLATDDTS